MPICLDDAQNGGVGMSCLANSCCFIQKTRLTAHEPARLRRSHMTPLCQAAHVLDGSGWPKQRRKRLGSSFSCQAKMCYAAIMFFKCHGVDVNYLSLEFKCEMLLQPTLAGSKLYGVSAFATGLQQNSNRGTTDCKIQ